MDFLGKLKQLLGGDSKPQRALPARQMAQPIARGGAAQGVPKAQRPFKMYEDNSFEGNPKNFRTANPGYNFYEDNTFSAPQRLRAVNSQPTQSLLPGADETVIDPQGYSYGINQPQPINGASLQGSTSRLRRMR